MLFSAAYFECLVNGRWSEYLKFTALDLQAGENCAQVIVMQGREWSCLQKDRMQALFGASLE